MTKRRALVLTLSLALVALPVVLGWRAMLRARTPHVWAPYHRFTPNLSPADAGSAPQPEVVLEFDFTKPGATMQGWRAGNHIAGLRVENGALRMRATGSDPAVVCPCEFSADAADAIQLDMQTEVSAPEAKSIRPEFFWLGSEVGTWNSQASVLLGRIGSTRATATALLVASPHWRGRITVLRVDPCEYPVEIAIYKIRLLRSGAWLADVLRERGEDLGRSSIGHVVKDTLIPPTREPLEFAAEVPPGALLEYSYGVVEAAWPARAPSVHFELAAVDPSGRTVLRRKHRLDPHTEGGKWYEERVELPRILIGATRFRFSTSPALAGAWGNPVLYTRQPEPGPRNVIIALFDAMRVCELGCYGAEPSLTPTMDELAASGLLFTDARATSSWTLPSVASLFSSAYPAEVVVRPPSPASSDPAQVAVRQPSSRRLSQHAVTLAELLRRHGYVTAGIVASPIVTHDAGYSQGFDTFDRGLASRYTEPACSSSLTSAAGSWLQRNRDRRFMLYLHYMDPHAPYNPPAPHREKVIDPDEKPPALGIIRRGEAGRTRVHIMETPGFRLADSDVTWMHDLYRGEVAHADSQLRELLDSLRECDLLDDTMVVVTADHGEEFMEHGFIEHGSSLYDEVVRVPLIIWSHGMSPALVKDRVSLLDLAPTILDASGAEAPEVFRGRSVLKPRELSGDGKPLLNQLGPWRGPSPSPWGDPREALLDGRYKLIHNLKTDGYELYDLARDPGEQANLRDRDPETLAAMKSRLRHVLGSLREAEAEARPVSQKQVDDALDALKDLGYVQ